MKQTFTEFMTEKKLSNRWTILLTALVGAFAGAVLMFVVVLMGFII
jgi:hypothetical protein